MVLESCMILLDNSEYMRNGDYVPTRLEAQHDAANLLVGAKTQSNPESTVGVIAMTGEIDGGGAELLISPTDDMGKILSSLHGIPIRSGGSSTGGAGASGKKRSASGEARATSPTSVVPPDGSDITGAIQVASLALKHRRNKNGAQRVVVFVGSPLTCDSRALTKCGRQLKKNNVAIDVIALGELEQNEPLLRELVDAANGTTSASSSGGGEGAAPAPPAETTCHLVTIPAGVLPSDVLVTSPIIHPGGAPAAAAVGAGGGGAGGDGGDAGGFAEYGGVDPNMDPELAMALRVSMEEERARQERAAAAAAAAAEGGGGEEGKAGEGGDAAAAGEGGAAKQADGTEAAAATEGGDGGATAMAVDGKAEASSAPSDEDALLQQALAMSMGEDGVASANAAAAAAAAQGEGGGAVGMETDDDDAAMQLALQMSMQTEGGADAPQKKEGEEKEVSATSAAGAGAGAGGATGQFQDQQFVNQLLGSLPGVDPNDPAIQDALRNLQQQQGQGGKKEGGEEGGTGDKKKDDK